MKFRKFLTKVAFTVLALWIPFFRTNINNLGNECINPNISQENRQTAVKWINGQLNKHTNRSLPGTDKHNAIFSGYLFVFPKFFVIFGVFLLTKSLKHGQWSRGETEYFKELST